MAAMNRPPGMLAVPVVVIIVIAAATQSVGVTKNIVFPIVNDDQGRSRPR